MTHFDLTLLLFANQIFEPNWFEVTAMDREFGSGDDILQLDGWMSTLFHTRGQKEAPRNCATWGSRFRRAWRPPTRTVSCWPPGGWPLVCAVGWECQLPEFSFFFASSLTNYLESQRARLGRALQSPLQETHEWSEPNLSDALDTSHWSI